MKDLIIILLLIGLLWGGYKGMIYLSAIAQTEHSESKTSEKLLADQKDKRLNKSAIKEMKKADSQVKKKKKPSIKKPATVNSAVEKSDGQKEMDAVRDTRLDVEGKVRSKEDFYTETDTKESKPYERKEKVTKNYSSANNASDLKDRRTAMEEKGKALAGEFTAKGNPNANTESRTSFNIETGKKETIVPTARPKEYAASSKNFIPSRYVLVAGSFANAENAVKEVLRLKKKGYSDASIVLSEQRLNLVSLGSYSNKAAASARAAQIKKSGIDLYVKGLR